MLRRELTLPLDFVMLVSSVPVGMTILSQREVSVQLEATVREVLLLPSLAMEASIIQVLENLLSSIAFSVHQASIALEMEVKLQLTTALMATIASLHHRSMISTRHPQATIL